MGAGDLQPVRLEIVDEHLAEAAFFAHGLLAGHRRTGRLLVFGCSRSDRTVPVGRGLEPVCAVLVTGGGAFDEPFVDPKLAAIAQWKRGVAELHRAVGAHPDQLAGIARHAHFGAFDEASPEWN